MASALRSWKRGWTISQDCWWRVTAITASACRTASAWGNKRRSGLRRPGNGRFSTLRGSGDKVQQIASFTSQFRELCIIAGHLAQLEHGRAEKLGGVGVFQVFQ